MNSDAVIGCDSVEAGKDDLRLKTSTGAPRVIPWNKVKIAGMGDALERQVPLQGVAPIVTPYFASHDSVIIVYGDGDFAQVMIEKSSPKRRWVLSTLAEHLGDRWEAGDLQASEMIGAMLIPPRVRIPRPVIVALALVAVAFFASIAILFFMHGAKPTSP